MRFTFNNAFKTAACARLDRAGNRLIQYDIEHLTWWEAKAMDDWGWRQRQTNAAGPNAPKVRFLKPRSSPQIVVFEEHVRRLFI
jgi:hypothetical protein